MGNNQVRVQSGAHGHTHTLWPTPAYFNINLNGEIAFISDAARQILWLGADADCSLVAFADKLFGVRAERLGILFQRVKEKSNGPFVIKSHLGSMPIVVEAFRGDDGGWTVCFASETGHGVLERVKPVSEENTQILTRAQAEGLLNAMPHGVGIFDRNLKLVVCNASFCDLSNRDPDLVAPGTEKTEIVDRLQSRNSISESQARTSLALIRKAIRENSEQKFRHTSKSGAEFEVVVRPTADGGYTVYYQDVSEVLLQTEENSRKGRALELHHQRFKTAVEHLGQGLAMFDANGVLVICNKAYLELYKLPENFARPGTPLKHILRHPNVARVAGVDGSKNVANMVANLERDSCPIMQTIKMEDGRHIELRVTPMQSGGFVSTHVDVTQRRLADQRMRHLARHDSLTNLPNRRAFLEALNDAFQSGLGDFALMSLDLDQFKLVNDTYGHGAGDQVLCEIADRIAALVQSNQMAARLGGDEICILLQSVSDVDELSAFAQKVIDAVARPIVLAGRTVELGTSIGIAIGHEHGESSNDLMRNADVALYHAKSRGRGQFYFFKPEFHASRNGKLPSGLRAAPAPTADQHKSTIKLPHFSPWFDVSGSALMGFDMDFSIADESFADAQRDELHNDWMLAQAVDTALSWPHHIGVGVPLLTEQLAREDFDFFVEDLLKRDGMSGARLRFIARASQLADINAQAAKSLRLLISLGVEVDLLNDLPDLKVEPLLADYPHMGLILDYWFFGKTSAHAAQKSEPKLVIGRKKARALWRNLEKRRTRLRAREVQTEEQMDFLVSLGCSVISGPILAPALPKNAADRFVAATQKSARLGDKAMKTASDTR